MKCVACGKEVKSKARKWPVCMNVECSRIRDRMKMKKSYYGKRPNVKNIEKMKKLLNTQELFATALVTIGSHKKMATHFKVSPKDITNLREELFGDYNPKKIHVMGRELIKPEQTPFVRNPIEVKVYKITDLAKFEQGGLETYEGLEFDRIEYANEIDLQTNELLEVV